MNNSMKKALMEAAKEICEMSSEEFLEEAKKCSNGEIYTFLMESEKFKINEINS